jgi:hypothetical protein
MEVMEYGLQAQQPGDYLPLAFTFGQSLIPKPSTPTNGHLPWPADDHSSSTANATSNADSLIEPDNQTITRKRRATPFRRFHFLVTQRHHAEIILERQLRLHFRSIRGHGFVV